MKPPARTRLPLLLAGLLSLCASCQLIYGLDEFRSGEDSGKGGGADPGGAGTGSGGPCACEAAPGPGWDGPYYVHPDPGDTTTWACPDDGLLSVGLVREGLPTTTCGACACAVQGACTSPTLTCYSDNNCTTGASAVSGSFSSCTAIGNDSCKLTAPAMPVTTCTSSGGDATKTDWGPAHALCAAAPSEGACESGEICVSPSVKDEARLCVTADGQKACPPGWPVKNEVHIDGGLDERTCSCACAVSGAVDCINAFQVSQFGCGSGDSTIPPDQCMSFGGGFLDAHFAKLYSPSAGTAQCTAGDVSLIGDFDPGRLVTVCCTEPWPGG